MIILEMLTSQPEHPAVEALKGFVISATPVKVPQNLIPPKPVVLALIALGAAFPKCAFTTAWHISSRRVTCLLIRGSLLLLNVLLKSLQRLQ